MSPALGKMPPSLKQLQRRSYLGGHGVLAFGQDALVLDLAVSLTQTHELCLGPVPSAP